VLAPFHLPFVKGNVEARSLDPDPVSVLSSLC